MSSVLDWGLSLSGKLGVSVEECCILQQPVCYLDDANGFPGEVEAGIEQKGEDKGEGSVPADRKHKRKVMRIEVQQIQPPPIN